MIGAILAAAAVWAMPAQATWDPATMPAVTVRLRLDSSPVSMKREAVFTVELSAPDGQIAVSRFLAHTRGIAFAVRDRHGELVPPLEPPPVSPPAPPQAYSALLPVRSAKGLFVHTGDPAKWIFPGPGLYRVEIVVFLMNFSDATWHMGAGRPTDVARFTSPPITVDVGD